MDLDPAPAAAPVLAYPGDAAATDTCTWPFPVQCVPGDGAEQILAEYCEIALRDDRKLAGTMVSFTPAGRTLTVLAGHSVSLEKLDFDDILTLRLPRPVAIQRPQQRLTADATRPLTQPYRLTLIDGLSLSGETIGSVEDGAGLYLFGSCNIAEVAGDEELQALAGEYCVESDLSPQAVVESWQQRHDGKIMLRRAKGCDECGQTGYRGRIGLYELFSLDRKSRGLIQQRSGMEELLRAAKSNGMLTLKQDGIDKIIDGHTDLKQVRAVCG